MRPKGRQPSKLFEPIIKPDLFWRVQDILKKRAIGKVRWKRTRHILTPFLRCGYCGYSMIATSVAIGDGWQTMYSCRHFDVQHTAYPAGILETEWLRFVEHLFIEASILKGYCTDAPSQPEADNQRSKISIQLSLITETLDQLASQLTDRDKTKRLSPEAYQRATTTIQKERDELQAQLHALPAANTSRLNKVWEQCNIDEKQEMLASRIRGIRVYRDYVSVGMNQYEVEFPVMRQAQAQGRGRANNVLLPRSFTVGNIEWIDLVLDEQFITDGEVNNKKVCRMNWGHDLIAGHFGKDFSYPLPRITKLAGETKQQYRARWIRERRSAAKR